MFGDDQSALLLLTAIVAAALGAAGEQWRAGRARRRWKARRGQATAPARTSKQTSPNAVDPSAQLLAVSTAPFNARRILSKAEARIFYGAERAIRACDLPWRVMAQVSLGEILSSPDPAAYGAVNSKRVDMLIISSGGDPLAAIEYQGSGHYLGSAPVRDAVKKEALRRAGVRYIEFMPDHGPDDIQREIARLAAAVNGSRRPTSSAAASDPSAHDPNATPDAPRRAPA
jgi:hypothetical protein